ncbi:MAG: hypothetical protein Q8934_08405 [Bacillota bacterium]|nr:hypothetical protein [Bacillota bacterium]
MKNRFLLKFFYDQEHFIILPVKASNPESLSNKITDSLKDERKWFSFPAKDKQTRVMGSERITVNLEKVTYFKIEIPTKVHLEKYFEDDFIEWEEYM